MRSQVSTNVPNREWAHERDSCRGLFASTSDLPSTLKVENLRVLTSGFLGGLLVKMFQLRFSTSSSRGTNRMFEITSRCPPAPSYEHTCGIVPNLPAESRYISASLLLRSIPGQLVLTMTMPVKFDRIGSSSERVISLGWTYTSCTLGSARAGPSVEQLASS